MILEKILAYKRKKVEEEKKEVPLEKLLSVMEKCGEARDFKYPFQNNRGILGIIAEIKKASPSRGVIREDFDPVEIARCYEKNRVEAISVLTEDGFFRGDTGYLTGIRKMTSVPLLRKDFIIDPYQIYQSKVLGADAVLLIAAALTGRELASFLEIAAEIGLHCLVEVHDRYELETVLETGAEIIGINNRDLRTFKTSLTITEKLIKHIPRNKIVISESGIKSREDMLYLQDLGVDGVLIGESLMKAESMDEKLRELRGQ